MDNERQDTENSAPTPDTVASQQDSFHFTFRDRPMPQPPKDMNDKAAVDKWLHHCWVLRAFFGSGN
jgi:hypothetical protein